MLTHLKLDVVINEEGQGLGDSGGRDKHSFTPTEPKSMTTAEAKVELI
jgi:hypothetical protein